MTKAEHARFFELNLAWLTGVLLLSSLEGAMIVGRGTTASDAVFDVGSAILTTLYAASWPGPRQLESQDVPGRMITGDGRWSM